MNHRFDSDEVIPAIRGISRAQCVELLQSHSVGRVAWQSADGPEILPVNYVWYDDSVVFRTAPNGLLAGLVWATDVAFEIDELNSRRREGWSVVLHGRTQAVGQVRTAGAADGGQRCRAVGGRRPQRLRQDHARQGDRPARDPADLT